MVVQRLGLGLVTLLVISLIIFGAIELLPGDLAEEILGQSATEETVAAFRKNLGLDQPAWKRYLQWLGGAVQGDLGVSLANQRPIGDLIGGRLGNTLFLALYAAAIAVPLSLFLGILAALYRNSLYDRMVNIVTLGSISFPRIFCRLYPDLCHCAGWAVSVDCFHQPRCLAWRKTIPDLPASLDPDPGGYRPYDAHDPGRDYQSSGLPLY